MVLRSHFSRGPKDTRYKLIKTSRDKDATARALNLISAAPGNQWSDLGRGVNS